MIILESNIENIQKIKKENPRAIIADVTINSNSEYRKLHPSFDWGNVPFPYEYGLVTTSSVEAVWNTLKIKENNNSRFRRDSYSNSIYDYLEARKNLLIPTYRWMLEHNAATVIKEMRRANSDKTIVLYDVEDNYSIENLDKPLSHAFLIKAYVEGLAPFEDVIIETTEHHTCCGRKYLCWVTHKKTFKEIPPKASQNPQLEIEFDQQLA